MFADIVAMLIQRQFPGITTLSPARATAEDAMVAIFLAG